MTTLSPEAQKAVEEAAIRDRERQALSAKMREGPYYFDGCLRIPSYFYNRITSPLANAEWKRRGLHWDATHKEWYIAIAHERARGQVAKARQLFDFFWDIDRVEEAQPC